jgi:hypothetical protein
MTPTAGIRIVCFTTAEGNWEGRYGETSKSGLAFGFLKRGTEGDGT